MGRGTHGLRARGVAQNQIKQLLAYAVGDATDEALTHIVQNVYSNSVTTRLLYVWIEDGRDVSGLIGYRFQRGFAEILHIAVDPRMRRRGIGRRVIDGVIAVEHPGELVAETDHDAVEFYRNYGIMASLSGL